MTWIFEKSLSLGLGPRRIEGCRKESFWCRIWSHQLQQEDPSNGRRTWFRHRKIEFFNHQGKFLLKSIFSRRFCLQGFEGWYTVSPVWNRWRLIFCRTDEAIKLHIWRISSLYWRYLTKNSSSMKPKRTLMNLNVVARSLKPVPPRTKKDSRNKKPHWRKPNLLPKKPTRSEYFFKSQWLSHWRTSKVSISV